MIYVSSDNDTLKKIVVGIAGSYIIPEEITTLYDPKSKWSFKNGVYPERQALSEELSSLAAALEKEGVEVITPHEGGVVNQIFPRDLGFVIGDSFFVANVTEEKKKEQATLLKSESFVEKVNEKQIKPIPENLYIEGGDIVITDEYLFIGVSSDSSNPQTSRTTPEAAEYMKQVTDKKVIPLFLEKNDHDPYCGSLHLDCCFMPLSSGHVLLHKKSFKKNSDIEKISTIFGKENLIEITKEEAFHLGANLLSISPNKVISDPFFERINSLLKKNGINHVPVSFKNIRLLGGSFRCATLPLQRS